MYSLRTEDGAFVAGLHYKPSVGMNIRIDSMDKWYKVTSLFGRIAYSKKINDPRGRLEDNDGR